MTDTWWKDAIIYAVDMEVFSDSNGDGVGDFKGLEERLPYLAELNVDCIWLLPFFPSGERDNGYDVTDYYRPDSKFGGFPEFLSFLHAAGELSIRIILDLVVQHTSDKHPWFQAARSDDKSRFRDYYIWSSHPSPPRPGRGPMFPGEEDSVWTYDDIARSYYHHRFYRFQPGLQHDNEEVRNEISRIIDFWLSFGVSGLRIDAASHLVERPTKDQEDEKHTTLRSIFKRAVETKPAVVVLGEVDDKPEIVASFFDGEQMNMMFNFLLNNQLLAALACESAKPIEQAIRELPERPPNCQWANFLRNLDEADLERLDEKHFEKAMEVFGPKKDMRIFGRGVRRRLAPMLDGDPQRLKMAYSLLFSMPGTPLIVYGDEIGMGEDLDLPGRLAVRPPMQWSDGRNGGFSPAPKSKLVRPVIEDGPFSFRKVNAESQRKDPDSLFSFIAKLAMLRRHNPSIGSGNPELLPCGHDAVLCHRIASPSGSLIFLHNLSGTKKSEIRMPEQDYLRTPAKIMIGNEDGRTFTSGDHLTLDPNECLWLRQQK